MALAGIASLILGVAPVSAATPYGSNLVDNPGAQAGSASADGQSPVAIPSWDTCCGDNMTVVRYGTSGFPTKNEGDRIRGGTKFFSTGPFSAAQDTCGDAQQTIILSGRGNAIDSGQVKVYLNGRVAAGGTRTVAHLDLYFRDSTNHQVAVNGIIKSVQATGNSFKSISGSKTLPKRTRTLRIHLWADGVDSGYCRAYFDKLSVVIRHT